MMIRVILFTSLFALAACAPNSSGSGNPAGSELAGDLGGHGTITSGGGNTVDGKMTERYSEDIERLPEYAHYIVPQLRKLSQLHADVLVAYLHWAAVNKTWYFVPVHLPALPKERIALAFQSDQIALHSEKEIFIDRQAYVAEAERERAFLLMHEMVMGAKLLMKQSPQKQCELLNGIIDPAICSDPAAMKTAVSDLTKLDSKDPEALLNGRDHESVRAMTVYLMDPKSDLQGSSVASHRLALDFNFPWDRALSRLNDDQIRSALERTTLARDTFTAVAESFASTQGSKCYMAADSKSGQWGITIGTGKITDPLFSQFRIVYQNFASNAVGLDARGVLDPNGSGEMVDIVEIEPYSQFHGTPYWNNPDSISIKLELYISRGYQPHLIEFRAVPVAVRTRVTYQGSQAVYENESIEIHSLNPLRCHVD